MVKEREWLAEAVKDPDTLFVRERLPLMHRLVEQNLIMDVYPRQEHLWIDQPPPRERPRTRHREIPSMANPHT